MPVPFTIEPSDPNSKNYVYVNDRKRPLVITSVSFRYTTSADVGTRQPGLAWGTASLRRLITSSVMLGPSASELVNFLANSTANISVPPTVGGMQIILAVDERIQMGAVNENVNDRISAIRIEGFVY